MRNRLLERRVPLAIFAVRQTQQQFKEFNMSLQTMQKMLRDVRGIADQTHLLSLMASALAHLLGQTAARFVFAIPFLLALLLYQEGDLFRAFELSHSSWMHAALLPRTA